MSAPFSFWAGPRRPKLLLVGEAHGIDEERTKTPFIGESGKELFRMLGEVIPIEPELHAKICSEMRFGLIWKRSREAWLDAAGIALTNVLNLHPEDNNLIHLCHSSKTKPKDYKLPPFYRPPQGGNFYLREEFFPHL